MTWSAGFSTREHRFALEHFIDGPAGTGILGEHHLIADRELHVAGVLHFPA
jgi:hypothetical protein